jgi:hypothetical protein
LSGDREAQAGSLSVNGAKSSQEFRTSRGWILSEFLMVAEPGIFEVAQAVLDDRADIRGVLDTAKPGGVEVL